MVRRLSHESAVLLFEKKQSTKAKQKKIKNEAEMQQKNKINSRCVLV